MTLPMFRRGDEELGKKDDEYRSGSRSRLRAWKQRRQLSHIPSPRRSLKRIAVALLAIVALFYFFARILRGGEKDGQSRGKLLKPSGLAASTQPATAAATGTVERDFNGPIKFYDLAPTLRAAERLSGASIYNQNVLFAAASLKSATILLPIACEMAVNARNDVHFAFLGRDDIPLDLLKSVNGVGKDCKIMLHGEWNGTAMTVEYI